MGTTTEASGWVLGGIVSAVMILVGMILSSKLETKTPVPMFFLMALGFGMATLWGWFPIWMIFFTVVFALMSVMGMLSQRATEG